MNVATNAEGGDALTMDQIQEGLLAAAELVDRYGDEMAPFYEFFEQQYLKAQDRQSAVERARGLMKHNKSLSQSLYIPKS